MAGRRQLFLISVSFLLLFFVSDTGARRRDSVCNSVKTIVTSSCSKDQFPCLNGKCIQRYGYCNGLNDCGDNSDEQYCGRYVNYVSCPTSFRRCENLNKCIPREWLCDGKTDCPSGDDERNCEARSVISSPSIDVKSPRTLAVSWMKTQIQRASSTEKWGPLVHKFAVALYLADPDFTSASNPIRKEMAYEMSIQLLSRLALKKLKDISSSDLASFINGLLVTCEDPRQFHGINLIQELRTRVDNSNFTNPYLLLTLCNAGDTITELDKQKLTDAFSSTHREFWTETQSIIVMAMTCAGNQSENGVDSEVMKEFSMELKQHQYRNGTVENLQTTALVLQALNSAETDEDPDNFDDNKAFQHILSLQQRDGSFGNFMKTYYVLPVLSCKSLVNISSSHCQTAPRDEDAALHYLVNQPVSKARIQYSLWVGDQRDTERTLAMRVPTNTSFYGIMEIAANIDNKYQFEYTVKNRKPYINMVSGVMDDPESGKFWFPYLIQDGKPVLVESSPADVIPKENEHVVMWYRKGSWMV